MRHGEAQAALFWPVRCFVEEVLNGRAPAGVSKALQACVAADVVLCFPPRWPEVSGRDAVGAVIARWRDAFAEEGRSSLHVAITRMEPHHAPSTPAGVSAPAGPAEGITWEIDWGARGRLAATSTQPSMLVRLEGTALATVTRDRLTGITVHALEAARVEHTEHVAGGAKRRRAG